MKYISELLKKQSHKGNAFTSLPESVNVSLSSSLNRGIENLQALLGALETIQDPRNRKSLDPRLVERTDQTLELVYAVNEKCKAIQKLVAEHIDIEEFIKEFDATM